MAPAPIRSCVETVSVGDAAEPLRAATDGLAELARQAWTLRVGGRPMLVRSASPRDLPAVAQMHRRCSARSLLDRYRCGGRPPTVAALEQALRNPLSFVVAAPGGAVVATGSVRRDRAHNYRCAEVTLLVEDAWQRQGIGAEMLTHLAGVAQVAGYGELIAYPATAIPAAQRLMIKIGRTRTTPDTDTHLHTGVPDNAALGLGSVRQFLAS